MKHLVRSPRLQKIYLVTILTVRCTDEFYLCTYGVVWASYANRAMTCVRSRPIYPSCIDCARREAPSRRHCNKVLSHKRRRGKRRNVPSTLHACRTNHVCTTVDDEPVGREHARANREEPNGAFEARCVCRLEEERNTLHIVRVWLAKQDRWHDTGDVRTPARTPKGNEMASPEDGRSKRAEPKCHAPSV